MKHYGKRIKSLSAGKEICVQRHSDPLADFSHRLSQIKFILLEIVIFLGFLMWLWDKAKHDIAFFSQPPTAAVQKK